MESPTVIIRKMKVDLGHYKSFSSKCHELNYSDAIVNSVNLSSLEIIKKLILKSNSHSTFVGIQNSFVLNFFFILFESNPISQKINI